MKKKKLIPKMKIKKIVLKIRKRKTILKEKIRIKHAHNLERESKTIIVGFWKEDPTDKRHELKLWTNHSGTFRDQSTNNHRIKIKRKIGNLQKRRIINLVIRKTIIQIVKMRNIAKRQLKICVKSAQIGKRIAIDSEI